MNKYDIIEELKSKGYNNDAKATQPDLYTTITCSQLFSDSNRLNAGWARGAYVIASFDSSKQYSLESLLQRWKDKTSSYSDQVLCLEVNTNEWKFYNHLGEEVEFNVLPPQFRVKLLPENNKDYTNNSILQTDYRESLNIDKKCILTALRTKPFVLLAGISGTGKSRLVKELAFMTCPDKDDFRADETTPYNYCLIEVKPNWHDSSELLGYYNALDSKYELTPFIRFSYRALQNPDVPFFVCLDEMNLAPVEQYFAEYLSVLETRTKTDKDIISAALLKKDIFKSLRDSDIVNNYNENDKTIIKYLQENGLHLPNNLYVIGTVNMDDTTHQFSRKVIDRAFTIEMNGGNLADMFNAENATALVYRKEDEVLPLAAIQSKFVSANEVFENTNMLQYKDTIKQEVPEHLDAINNILKDTPFQVSYRVQNELILYLAYLIEQANFPEDITPLIKEATLAILLQKILPRIQGDDKLLGKTDGKDVFIELKNFVEKNFILKENLQDNENNLEVQSAPSFYTPVIDKLDKMHTRLTNSYFANFF